ncbi:hypothetical protein N9115_01655 [bacterium]|nr:hypothetical protein [Akkermansiaceae bacterium]MDB4577353.1 hypothetical protein [bacterium]
MIKLRQVLAFIWVSQATLIFAENPSTISVTQTGAAKSRDGALVDACRLAVAQIHGTRVTGSLIKTNENLTLKAAASGTNGSSSEREELQLDVGREVQDQTQITFGGLLAAYKVTNESQPKNATDLWKITIAADVLTTIPDRFEGRTAVVVPSVPFLSQAINMGPRDVRFVTSLRSSIEGWFANNSSFVILERNRAAESFLDSELSRASSSGAARAEQSKLGMEKTADIVLIVESPGVFFETSSTSFKRLKTQAHTCQANLQLTFKLVDGATKGEISRETVILEAKATARDPDSAKKSSLTEMTKSLSKKLDFAGLRLLGAMDCNRVRIGEGGALELLSPRRMIDFKVYGSLQLRLVAKSDGSSIESTADLGRSGSAEFNLGQDGKLWVGWSDKFSVGDILWFAPAAE